MNVQVKSEIPRCPGAPTFQEIMRSDGGVIKDVLVAQSNPPQSRDDIPFNKYINQDFFNLEMKKMWEKVWQYVCREDQVAEPGDYLVYDLGRHSIVVPQCDAGMVTPGQEFRIRSDVNHQRIHFFGQVPDQDGLVDGFHRMHTCAGL